MANALQHADAILKRDRDIVLAAVKSRWSMRCSMRMQS
jgi:hypothetical protein